MHEIIILVATYGIGLSVAGVIFVLLRLPNTKRFQFIGTVLIAGILAYVLAKIGSWLYYDPRPFVEGHFTPLLSHAADNGFPSDHTLLAALLGFITLLHSRKIGGSLLIIALLIGLSRMAGGVHHSWDVLGSFVCAAIGVWFAQRLTTHIWRQPS